MLELCLCNFPLFFFLAPPPCSPKWWYHDFYSERSKFRPCFHRLTNQSRRRTDHKKSMCISLSKLTREKLMKHVKMIIIVDAIIWAWAAWKHSISLCHARSVCVCMKCGTWWHFVLRQHVTHIRLCTYNVEPETPTHSLFVFSPCELLRLNGR